MNGEPVQTWTREQVRRLAHVTERQLKSWERQQLVPALGAYEFGDLIALRTLAKLRRMRVPAARIRKSLDWLRRTLRDVKNPLTELKIFSDAGRLGVEIEGQKVEAISGQLLLDFDAEELHRMLAFPARPPAPPGRERARKAEADHWFQVGLDLEQRGAAFDEIAQAYQKAFECNPSSPGPLVNLGTLYYHTKEWLESEKYYRMALEVDPDYALAHFNLGNLFDETGDRARAFFHYHAALRLQPDYADVHYNLALLHQVSGQIMKAVSHWTAYLKLDPASSWAEIARRELERLRRIAVVEGSGAGRTEQPLTRSEM